jgi:hypothetical protein
VTAPSSPRCKTDEFGLTRLPGEPVKAAAWPSCMGSSARADQRGGNRRLDRVFEEGAAASGTFSVEVGVEARGGRHGGLRRAGKLEAKGDPNLP